jgi:hypothetical protein
MADEQVEPANERPAVQGRKWLRLFLMVAGGLAAPCLALAAFFLSSSAGDDPPARPPAVQAGLVAGTKAAGQPAPAKAPGPAATTTTTTAPAAVPPGPVRDPFAPLVSAPSPGGTAPR